MHAAYRQLVLQRGELHILTPGWPKIGGVGDFGQTTRVPLSGCRLSGYGRWPRGRMGGCELQLSDSAAALELELSGWCGSGFEALELLDAVHNVLGRLGLWFERNK